MLYRSNTTADRVRELFNYDPRSGCLTWKKTNSNRVKEGDRAGCAVGKYRAVYIDGVRYVEHRVIWLFVTGVWPYDQIDHRNLDKHDNRWTNLREATNGLNQCNRRTYASNKCGVKGIRQTPNGNWQARISLNKKTINLGTFTSKEKASSVVREAARRHHGEFARTS